jgi:DNA-binding ferritin-like protein
VVVALALAAGSWWYLRGRKTNEVAQQEDVPVQQQIDVPATAEPQPVFGGPSAAELRREALKTAIAAGSADGKWAQSLKDLLEKNGTIVSAALRDAADGANAVTPDARDLLLDLAAKIDAKQALTKGDRDNVRQLLVDYTAAQQDVTVSVDGSLRDVKAALLKRLKERYKVVTKATDKTDADLQSEIILRWLESTAR